MTKTRIVYRIGPTCDGDDCFWQVAEEADGFGARIRTPDSYGAAEFLLDGPPAPLRAIAAALVRIADAQDAARAE